MSAEGLLQQVTERTWIESSAQGIAFSEDEGKTFTKLPDDVLVSMNFWGFPRSFLQKVRDGFPDFLTRASKENPLKAEYFLPSVVSSMIEQDGARVKVMTSRDRWYGVTYPQDKQTVVQAFEQMSEQGLYPQPLWQE